MEHKPLGCHGVLVVEDDSDIREGLAQVLTTHGFTAATVEHGAAALDRLRAHPAKHPCVILLDVWMPVMDGKTFRDEVAADPKLSKIPIVVLTADMAGERAAREMRVDGFLKKPFDVRMLLDVVGLYCESEDR